jgi:hypothetical protein
MMWKLSKCLIVAAVVFIAGCTTPLKSVLDIPPSGAKLAITTTSLPGGTTGVAYSGLVIATGGVNPYTFSASNLPSGLTIDATTGEISGKPAQSTVGTTSVTLTVTDSTAPTPQTATTMLSITIAAPAIPAKLTITSTSLPSGTVGVAYNGSITATGGTPPYTYIAPNLPAGLTINQATGIITGTPGQAAVGTTSVSIIVSDTEPQTATATLSLTIAAAVVGPSAPSITTTSLPGGTVGVAYTGSIAATGGTPPYTFSAPSLPTGLSINPSTGAITGMPAQGTAGTTSLSFTVTDSTQPTAQTATASLSLTIAAATQPGKLTITTTTLPAGTEGAAYTGAIAATGGTPPYTFSATGLPSLLSINPATGAITGTPAQNAIGTTSVTFGVTDSAVPTAATASADLSITVSAATTAASCGNMSLGTVANLNGFVPFPSSDAWNTNIAAAPVDPKSATIISGLTGNNLHPDFGTVADNYGIPYVVVDSSVTPGVPVTMTGGSDYDPTSDITLYPIPLTAEVEGEAGKTANCNVNGDQHLLVIDKNKCWLYETWETELCNGTWEANNGAIWDLTTSEKRPYGWTSADAAGLPIFPGLVKYEEVAAGAINHAIRVTVQNTRNDSNGGYFVAPAVHAAGTSSSTNNIIGMRLRLKASFNISGFSAANQVILKAMQQYGLIVADNGGNMFFQGTTDARWDDNDLDNLKTIDASQFDVVQMAPAWPGYDANTAPTGAVPVISSFTSSANNVAPGTTVTLNWTVTGDSYDFIDVVGPVRNGTQTVAPAVTTTYTLESTNQFGRSTKQVTVDVQ